MGPRCAQGFIKLCDFGFARRLNGDRTYTKCGTPDYTSPEMLLNEGVNLASDWWALGVLTFELLTGAPPFTDPDGDDMTTYRNILSANIDWEAHREVSLGARRLLEGLLTIKVAYRLGYLKGGAQVLSDPFDRHAHRSLKSSITLVKGGPCCFTGCDQSSLVLKFGLGWVS